ncbi:MAG: hypothetical protein WCE75_08980 [Terracidiphilus sp.]
MKRIPLGAWLWVGLAVAVFLSIGMPLADRTFLREVDFKGVYYGTRCLLAHGDPYNEAQLRSFYLADARPQASPPGNERIITLYVNLPTAFPFLAPFAMLAWGPAHYLWLGVTAVLFVLAGLLMWSLAARDSPAAAGSMLFLLFAGSEILLEVGNTAGIAVSLCVIAVWCFLRSRFIAAGVLCLAFSLLIKPHDSGFIWLYLLLSGGLLRRRALQTLAATLLLALPGVLWVALAAPGWLPEMRGNLATIAAPGGLNDPGPAFVDPRDHGSIQISLQTVLAVFVDRPGFYNTVAWAVAGPLLALWTFATLRARPPSSHAWLGLAAVAALSLLPVYHRQHDTRLLMLTLPACAQLWGEGGLAGQLALLVNGAALLATGDLSMQFFTTLAHPLVDAASGAGAQVLTALLLRPAPLALLLVGCFYLWIYVRRCMSGCARGQT